MLARVAAVLAGILVYSHATSAVAADGDHDPSHYLQICALASNQSLCESSYKQLSREWPKALKGDYQSQRNVAFCLSTGCDGAVRISKTLGCAWRIVLLASGSSRIVSTDKSNLDLFCAEGLSEDDRAMASTQAERLFQEIYRRPLPTRGPWVLATRPAQLPAVNLGLLSQAADTFNAASSRIGFDRPIRAVLITCTPGAASTTCSLKIGQSFVAIAGSDASRQRLRDITLMRGADGDGTDWINALTTIMALMEPDAKPQDLRAAISALHAPLVAGKTEFSVAYDLSRSRFTSSAHPMMGLMIVASPRG